MKHDWSIIPVAIKKCGAIDHLVGRGARPLGRHCGTGRTRSHRWATDRTKENGVATPKVIVQIYPVLPAEDRADRERKRPLGRNREVYHRCCMKLLTW